MNVRPSFHDELTRRTIEDTIERLIAILDAFDGNADLEDGWDNEASDNGIADLDALELQQGWSNP